MTTIRDLPRRWSWLVAALAAAAAAATPGGALGPWLTPVVLAITWGVTPGAWIARRLASSQASDTRGALALVASPFGCGAAFALARVGGMDATLAAQAISVVVALLATGEVLRPAPSERTDVDTHASWWLALAFGAVVLLAHGLRPALSWRSDGSFHAGVVRAIVQALPPEDPFNAGLPLRYAWGTHAWAAGWLALSPRLGPFTPLVCSNVGAAIAALLAVGALARRLGGSTGAGRLAQILALVGAAPFSWLLFAARSTRGEVQGAAELQRALFFGVDGVLRALDPGWLHPSLVLPLDKFIVITPFAWALAGAAVAWLAVASWVDTGTRRSLVWLAVAIAAVMFAHPFMGTALVLSGLAGTALASRRADVRSHPWGLAFAFLAAMLVTLPYVLALARPGGEQAMLRLGVSIAGLVSTVIGGAIVLPMGWRVLSASPKRDAFPDFALGALGLLVVAGCVLAIAGQNQSKFLNVAFLLAAAPAAVGWMRLRMTWRWLAAIVLAFAVGPTIAISLWAYAHENDRSYDVPDRHPHEILAAVDRWVPRDAIFVDFSAVGRAAAPALPGETGRSLLTSYVNKSGHADSVISIREKVGYGIVGGRWPAHGMADTVGIPGREIWLLRRTDMTRTESLVPPPEQVIVQAGKMELVRYRAR